MTMVVRGKAAAWVDGRPVKLTLTRQRKDGANEYKVVLSTPSATPAVVAIRVEQERGSYAGAAFAEPVAFECGSGTIGAGDWSRIDGLSSYSGGAWYRKSVTLSTDQLRRPAWLDLGMVSSSAEIVVNGKHAGVKLSPPYRVEISKFLKTGENRIEVLVYSAIYFAGREGLFITPAVEAQTRPPCPSFCRFPSAFPNRKSYKLFRLLNAGDLQV
jgi:hypothetical protein